MVLNRNRQEDRETAVTWLECLLESILEHPDCPALLEQELQAEQLQIAGVQQLLKCAGFVDSDDGGRLVLSPPPFAEVDQAKIHGVLDTLCCTLPYVSLRLDRMPLSTLTVR